VHEVARSGGGATSYLFRIDEDPTESHDLSVKNPELVAGLVERIERWRRLHPANGVRASAPPPGWHGPKLWAEAAL